MCAAITHTPVYLHMDVNRPFRSTVPGQPVFISGFCPTKPAGEQHFFRLIKPENKIDDLKTRAHGLSDRDVIGANSFGAVFHEFSEWAGERVLLIANRMFRRMQVILHASCKKHDMPDHAQDFASRYEPDARPLSERKWRSFDIDYLAGCRDRSLSKLDLKGKCTSLGIDLPSDRPVGGEQVFEVTNRLAAGCNLDLLYPKMLETEHPVKSVANAIRSNLLTRRDAIDATVTQLVRPIFYDTETTGLPIRYKEGARRGWIALEKDVIPKQPHIIELALEDGSKPHGERVFHRYIRPVKYIEGRTITERVPAESTAVHHIHDEELKDAPTFKEIIPGLKTFVDAPMNGKKAQAVLIAHNNNGFDYPLMIVNFKRCEEKLPWKWQWFDTYKLARKLPIPKPLKLQVLAERCGINVEAAHTAGDDTRVLRLVFEKMCGAANMDDINQAMILDKKVRHERVAEVIMAAGGPHSLIMGEEEAPALVLFEDEVAYEEPLEVERGTKRKGSIDFSEPTYVPARPKKRTKVA